MEIKTVSIIGLGALGVMYANHLSQRMPENDLRIIADKSRIERYQRDGIFCNDKPCRFHYVLPDEPCTPADLLIFAVKYDGLFNALKAVKNHVGERTIILSLLNGIVSEEDIGSVYGIDKVLYCVAQGMDAVKAENRLTYEHMGLLFFGERETGVVSERMKAVSDFFCKTEVPFEMDTDMVKRLWGKFMLNVGVNQTVAVYGTDYGDIQKEGRLREIMISAMKEVIVLSEKEGIFLKEEELPYWLRILDSLNPRGKPSMRQDIEARRKSEVELFSGTVLKLAKKHQLSAPVNQDLYDKLRAMENRY